MKKIIILVTIIILALSINKKNMKEDMIRFRIIANSNNEEDQLLKKKVLNSIASDLIGFIGKTKEEEKNYLVGSIPKFKEKIEEETNDYKIDYGMHYFPEKEENNEIYKEGEYESLVITLGDGLGDNFWCILFPPICMIDDENVEYKSFIKEALSKLF